MSKSTINRLLRYKNALKRLKKLGFLKVFSDNLADAVGVTPSQVRKDFSVFGLSGNKRGGYKVEELLTDINKILGKDRDYGAIVVGAGNIGSALIKYKGFEKENIFIRAAFDIDVSKCSRESDVPVLSIDSMGAFIKDNKIKIGIIAVPEIAAQHVFDIMVTSGITGVLNFAPIRLRGSDEVVISSVNLGMELENIIYYVNAEERSEK